MSYFILSSALDSSGIRLSYLTTSLASRITIILKFPLKTLKTLKLNKNSLLVKKQLKQHVKGIVVHSLQRSIRIKVIPQVATVGKFGV